MRIIQHFYKIGELNKFVMIYLSCPFEQRCWIYTKTVEIRKLS